MGNGIPESGKQILRVVKETAPITSGYSTDSNSKTRLFSANPTVEVMLQYLKNEFGARNDALASELKDTNQKLSKTNDQMFRVGNTLDRLASKFDEQVVTGVNPDLMIAPHDPQRTDVTLVASSLPAELSYPCTTKELAAFVNIHHSRLGTYFKMAGINGDPKYHYAFSTGKSSINKYKLRALQALHEYMIQNKPTWIKPDAAAALDRYITLHRDI